MSIVKEIWIEEYENIMSEAEEAGIPISEDKAGELATQRQRERFFDMCDEAKDRAKYRGIV